MPHLSRRRFLWHGLALTSGGAVLLAGCGGGDDDGDGAASGATTGGTGAAATTGAASPAAPVGPDGVTADEQARLPLVVLVASADLAVGTNRFAFGIVEQATGKRWPPTEPVEVGFSPPLAAGATRIPLAPAFVAAPYHGDGLDTEGATGTDVHGVYVVTTDFDQPGPDANPWYVWVRSGDQVGVSPVAVGQATKVVDVGASAPKAASPTVGATLGVDPICTRSPACDLHAVSLADVIGTKPVVVSFSTPARCTSQLCGPTLDMLIEQVPAYQDRVAFVHVEIFQNNATTDVIQTVRDWGLPTEPWVFAIGKDGTIVGRLDSAFDRTEVRTLVEAAAATA
jgi:hypothetical protein